MSTKCVSLPDSSFKHLNRLSTPQPPATDESRWRSRSFPGPFHRPPTASNTYPQPQTNPTPHAQNPPPHARQW